MTEKRITGGIFMGEPVSTEIELEIEVADEAVGERVPGLGWTMAQETIEALRDIDESIRSAEQISGNIIFG